MTGMNWQQILSYVACNPLRIYGRLCVVLLVREKERKFACFRASDAFGHYNNRVRNLNNSTSKNTCMCILCPKFAGNPSFFAHHFLDRNLDKAWVSFQLLVSPKYRIPYHIIKLLHFAF